LTFIGIKTAPRERRAENLIPAAAGPRRNGIFVSLHYRRRRFWRPDKGLRDAV
jgi:hypothetical protein